MGTPVKMANLEFTITAKPSCGSKTFKAGESWTTTGCYDMETTLTPVRMRFTELNQGDEVFVNLT